MKKLENKISEGKMEKLEGREDKKSNDLFYTCSLIDFIARKTKNKRNDIVKSLGEKRLQKIYDLAEIYHSDNIENVALDFIEECNIQNGNFDNISNAKYEIPTYWDIGKVYKRLILKIADSENISMIQALQNAYNSIVSDKISDYNSAFYYDNPDNIFLAYQESKENL